MRIQHTDTDRLLYDVLTRNGEKWNGTALEAYDVGNWSTYATAGTEDPAGGYEYVFDDPTGLAPGFCIREIFEREDSGIGAARSDPVRMTLYGYWDGSVFHVQDTAAILNAHGLTEIGSDNEHTPLRKGTDATATGSTIKARTDNLPATPISLADKIPAQFDWDDDVTSKPVVLDRLGVMVEEHESSWRYTAAALGAITPENMLRVGQIYQWTNLVTNVQTTVRADFIP